MVIVGAVKKEPLDNSNRKVNADVNQKAFNPAEYDDIDNLQQIDDDNSSVVDKEYEGSMYYDY